MLNPSLRPDVRFCVRAVRRAWGRNPYVRTGSQLGTTDALARVCGHRLPS